MGYIKTVEGELEMIDTPEVAYLLEEQEKKIANLICENYRLKGLLEDAGIPYIYDVKSEERHFK
jgi:hypothetical protein